MTTHVLDTLNAGGSPSLVRLRNVSRKFGDVTAVHNHDLDIKEGEFLALLGPSGCGKTTLLRMIGGFLEPTTGTIEIAGEDMTELGPEKRRTNMVFQGYGLFPHMTVRQNIAYGLVLAKTPKPEIDSRVKQTLSLVHLEGFEDRLPSALSGGQAQRVALARALIMNPAVLLLDESLAALDLKLRKAMQDELREIHKSVGGTFVFVTHDQGEAMALATRIAVMKDGRIVQQGTPKEIYEHPANEFVASFIGEANKILAFRESGTVSIPGFPTLKGFDGPDGEVALIIRPDAIKFVEPGAACDYSVSGQVMDQIYFGTHTTYTIELESALQVTVVHPISSNDSDPKVGDSIVLGWARDHCTVVTVD